MKRMVVLCGVLFSVSSMAFGALSYTAVTKAKGGPGADMQDGTIKGLADGTQARVEFVEGRNPMAKPGSYIVTKDAGKTVTLVNPAERTYMRWDIEKFTAAAGDVMKAMGSFMTITVKDHKVEKLIDEAGPKMLGRATRHVKVKTSYTMETSVMGMKQSQAQSRIDEIWATTKVDEEGLMFWSKQQRIRTGNESIDKLIEAELSQIQGFPLKRITETTMTDRGRAQTTTVTFEVTALENAKAPAGAFDVPAGYKEETMELPNVSEAGEQEADDDRGRPKAQTNPMDSLRKMFGPSK